MPKAKLTEAERNVMSSFWHDELDFEFGPTLLWRLDNGIAHSEFFDMMHVACKELESKGKNEVDLPVEPVEIPWTVNVISRAPSPTAPRSFVDALEVSGHDGFDRVLFRLSSDAPFAGYDVRIVEGGSVQLCGEEEQNVGAEGDRVLVVALTPARAREEGRTGPPLGMSDYGYTRFLEGGIICENQTQVTWVSTLGESEQVRALEFRSPQRLLVDVR